MSGHFLLLNISDKEIQDIQNAWIKDKLVPPTLGPLQHTNVGWNDASRNVLAQAQTPQGIPNRNGLPPHRYLDFGVNQIGNQGIAYLIQNQADQGWITRLQRPNMGLTALTQNAQSEWNLGRKREAFVMQLKGNGATLEIYYRNGQEIT